jgi:pimeloyl-ACP methyl ester carboxylesterase
MTTGLIDRGGLSLCYDDVGLGPAVIFQHGLGGDAAQVNEVFPAIPPVRRITLECRAQGKSEPGPLPELSIATFADDIAFLAAKLGIGRAIVGGISMGAAIALRLAVRRPDLVGALVLCRPAWLFGPAPGNMRPIALVAELLRSMDPDLARQALERSETAIRLAREAPDNLASLRGFFTRPNPAVTAALLGSIAADGPRVTGDEVRTIAVPTLVIGTSADAVHPLDMAAKLAATIPGAKLIEVASKSVDRTRYVAEFRAALTAFLERTACLDGLIGRREPCRRSPDRTGRVCRDRCRSRRRNRPARQSSCPS